MCNYASIFWSWKWRKNMRFVRKISVQKNLEKSTGFLAFFDVVNCNNECKPVKPQLTKNHEKTCAFLKIFLTWEILNKFYIFVQFFGSKNGGKIGHILRFLWNIFWIRNFWDVCSVTLSRLYMSSLYTYFTGLISIRAAHPQILYYSLNYLKHITHGSLNLRSWFHFGCSVCIQFEYNWIP